MNNNANTLSFDISHLLAKASGATDTYSFDGPAEFEEIKLLSNVKGRVEIMRINSSTEGEDDHIDGFNVELMDFECDVELECKKCLKEFKKKISIGKTDRIFFLGKPRRSDDPNDLFMVDKKKLKLDISEMLRQEIILHFPLISVCLNGCKGVCPVCGKDKNATDCDCKTETESVDTGNKPLAILKQLFK